MNTDESNEVRLKSKIELFVVSPSDKPEETEQTTVARLEQTEDGIEWMPYFGSIYVTIK